MSHITEIFERANIQDLREFLLHGTEENHPTAKSYEERLDGVQEELEKAVSLICPDTRKCEKIVDEALICTDVLTEIYMEIGLRCGLILSMQIFQNKNGNEERREAE